MTPAGMGNPGRKGGAPKGGMPAAEGSRGATRRHLKGMLMLCSPSPAILHHERLHSPRPLKEANTLIHSV